MLKHLFTLPAPHGDTHNQVKGALVPFAGNLMLLHYAALVERTIAFAKRLHNSPSCFLLEATEGIPGSIHAWLFRVFGWCYPLEVQSLKFSIHIIGEN